MIHWLPHIDATLNGIATVLLVTGYTLIRRGKVDAHRRAMLACFGVSVLFLTCYLIYHFNEPSKPFPKTGYPAWMRYGYYVLLGTHVILAAIVPFLAIRTIYLGLRDRRVEHRRLARWTFPIWLYVSVTGVAVYIILYWLCPPLTQTAWSH
jgi:uncharacterized membrane protein YozB (DUF420 family)